MISIDDTTFDETVKGSPVVLVDFYADWCAPCRALKPLLEKLEGEYTGVTFAKLDTEVGTAKTTELRINSIPAIFIYKNGELARNFVGLVKESVLREALDTVLKDGTGS